MPPLLAKPRLSPTTLSALLASCAIVALAPASLAQVDPASGIDFVTITSPNNAPWLGDGSPGDMAIGRGSVPYDFNIGRYEVTTAQWVEFLNAARDRPAGNTVPWRAVPFTWGARATTPLNASNAQARRWEVLPGEAMRPVGGMSWRMSAIFCNWLHNNKSSERSAFLSGAYDVSTFGATMNGSIPIFTDQLTRSPGARYFIPSWDEWLKAAHYDPNKQNPDGTTGGWWRSSNGSDAAPVYGPPGTLINGQPTTANSAWDGFDYPGQDPFRVPLGAYTTTNPWGLFDVAGATSEWTEGTRTGIAGDLLRFSDGSSWLDTSPAGAFILDKISQAEGWTDPASPSFSLGLRVASAVPAPSASVVLLFAVILRRRTR